ncbi:MAG TPA: DUF4383 domain-containing protein [Solirubrobacterales bacterium]|nr:DUF4383 domain-containing protein [Solirubrobacterales bacterium]
MEAATPARLYACVAGPVLLLLGVVGFFYTASFGDLDSYEEALGALQVNGWLNVLYLATGAIGVLVAGVSSRPYSLAVGGLYLALAIVGWGSEWLNLLVGLLGLAAAWGTPRGESRRPRARRETPRKPRRSKPRAQAARQRP